MSRKFTSKKLLCSDDAITYLRCLLPNEDITWQDVADYILDKVLVCYANPDNSRDNPDLWQLTTSNNGLNIPSAYSTTAFCIDTKFRESATATIKNIKTGETREVTAQVYPLYFLPSDIEVLANKINSTPPKQQQVTELEAATQTPVSKSLDPRKETTYLQIIAALIITDARNLTLDKPFQDAAVISKRLERLGAQSPRSKQVIAGILKEAKNILEK